MISTVGVVGIFASAGGGGSGGGGGGGGGGGDGLFIVFMIGYGLGYFANKLVKSYVNEKFRVKVSLLVTGFLTLGIVAGGFAIVRNAALTDVGGGVLWGSLDLLVLAGLWSAWYAVIYGVWGKLKNRIKTADKEIAVAKEGDPAWQEEKLHDLAQLTFLRYQDDWTRLDTNGLSEYMTPKYEKKATQLMQVLRDMNRQNAVVDPKILKMDIVDVHDDTDNHKDQFTIAIEATAQDVLIDLNTNEQIFENNKSFVEYWTFIRNNHDWKLDNLEQDTAELSSMQRTIKEFAEQNDYVYSLDMGWLFLPARGQVFEDGSFGVSDINNHTAGVYKDLPIQIYTYCPKPRADNRQYFAIAQINLPKSYGNILVRPKVRFGGFITLTESNIVKPIENSTEYVFEWPDFNKKFQVYATEDDRLASFELINPKFMEMMYEVDTDMVLEVVDNIVYFRVSSTVAAEIYPQLLELLKQAYKELKL